jgi:hypothetical protein
MRNKKSPRAMLAPDETIGHLGKVCLVKKADGRHDLIGGTSAERTSVRKWCERHAPFLVFLESPREELFLAA